MHPLSTSLTQRKDLRVAWRLDVGLRMLPDGPTVPGRTLNVATGGLALVAEGALAVDSTVLVECDLPDGVHTRTMQIPAVVLRCAAAGAAEFSVAVVFQDLDSRDRAFLRTCVLGQALRQMQSLTEYQAFREVADLDLLELASVSHEQRVTAGTVVVRYGDEADSVFLIKRGKVELRPAGSGGAADGQDESCEVVHAGQVFGEVPTLLGLPHSLDAVAVEDTELLVVPRASLSYLREHNPHLALVLYEIFVAFLGRRVRRLTSRLAVPHLG